MDIFEPERVVFVIRRPYGCLSFLGDVFMTVITCGFWLIWIFVREMRNRRAASPPQ